VWDVGANRGIYARQFCEWTGPSGRVFAFEPVPNSFEELRRSTAEFAWSHQEQLALGDVDEDALFAISSEDYMNSFAKDSGYPPTEDQVMVEWSAGTRTGDVGVTPNIIKIDVEAFEEEVLAGMDGLPASPEVRAVLMEVHFAVLETRNRLEAPVRIEKLLRSNVFQPKWVDASHLAAVRRTR
jgi:FkbM family methyltransferase